MVRCLKKIRSPSRQNLKLKRRDTAKQATANSCFSCNAGLAKAHRYEPDINPSSLLAGLPHFNARKWHKGLYDNQPKGLKQTVEAIGLDWRGTYHRGIDDARNVSSIVKEMLG